MISVILLTYKTSKYIEDTILSLANQTSKAFEALFIAHKEDKETLEVLNNHIEKYPHMKIVLLEKDHGPGHDRNVGLKESQYHYVHFIDGDDMLDLNFIKDYTQAIVSYPSVDIFCGDTLYFSDSDWIKAGSSSFLEKLKSLKNFKSSYVEKTSPYQVAYHSKVYRKDLLLSRELLFPDTKIFYDDFLHYQLIFFQKEKIIFQKVEDSAFYTLYRNRIGSTVNLPVEGSSYYTAINHYVLDYNKKTNRLELTDEFYIQYLNSFHYLYCQALRNNLGKKDFAAIQKNKEHWMNECLTDQDITRLKNTAQISHYVLLSKVTDYQYAYLFEYRFAKYLKIAIRKLFIFNFSFYPIMFAIIVQKTCHLVIKFINSLENLFIKYAKKHVK